MMQTEPYLQQQEHWPQAGRHILANYDDTSVVVYQAYRPSIGNYAAAHGRFGGKFSYERMSWIKPNFLWMMYRSGWGTKEGQEVTLAVRLPREFFDEVLASAVPSSYDHDLFESRPDWSRAVKRSAVRLQWDPDHSPTGDKEERRAVQLGLRGEPLRRYGSEEAIEITDISDFVAEQRENRFRAKWGELITPLERVYVPRDPSVAKRLRLSEWHPE